MDKTSGGFAALIATLLVTGCGHGPEAGAGTPAVGNGTSKAASRNTPVDPARLPAGAVMLVRTTIEDPGVINKGPALTALIPAGWRSSGGIVATQGLCSEPYAVEWRAESPDGSSALGIFPTESWQWSTFTMQSTCQRAPMRSLREYLEVKAGRLFPGARVLDFRERPDFAKSAADNAARTNAIYAQNGFPNMRAWAEGGEVLVAFQRNGVEMRGVVGATAAFYAGRDRNPFDGSTMEHLTASVLGTFMAMAPDKHLDFDLVEASRRSIQPQPAWLDRLFALKNAIGEINVQATRERAAMIVAGGAEATRSNIAAFRQIAQNSIANSNDSIARQQASTARENFPGDAAGDRMQRENIEAIRGVETYRDPVSGGNVQLDANYEHAWRINNQDGYILTRDPNFNPGLYDIQATKMGVVQ